jgi:hypothetical protein
MAQAGADQSVNVGDVVQLDGLGSSDPEGSTLAYSWSMVSQPAGSAANLQNPASPTPTFIPDVGGDYVEILVVNDGSLSSEPDDCTISANTPPVANAGPNQTVGSGAVVQLDGTGSHDADGDDLTYHWSILSRPAGSAATLSQPDIPDPTFPADVPGPYSVELAVSDGRASDSDRVLIEAQVRPRAGRYTGTTSQGRPISSTVSASQDAIEPGLEMKFDLVCATSSWIVTIGVGNNSPITNGRFSINVPTCIPAPCENPIFYVGGRVTSETTFSGTATDWVCGHPGEGCPSTVDVTWQASWAGPAPVGEDAARMKRKTSPDIRRTVSGGVCIDEKVTEREGG